MNDIPGNEFKKGNLTYRSITVDGEEIQFSGGFTELHTQVYKDILSGNGFGINDARPSIGLVHKIRKSPISSGNGTVHFMTKKYLKNHTQIPAGHLSDQSN
jgi:UDP-N-acetyl-2-amino-2-deoxyglucuronate dehydrogenase